jgi:glycosyltransferase 2 family protein
MRPLPARLSFNRQSLLVTGLFVVALYVILPQLAAFRSSRHLLLHPEAPWIILAIGLTGLTYLAAAATYGLLAFKPLRYPTTVITQLAAMFVNRLLPSGLGALGISYAYLRRMGHNSIQAGSVVAINNLLGVVGNALLAGLTLALAGSSALPGYNRALGFIIKVVLAGLVLAIGLALVLRRRRVNKTMLEIRRDIISYRQRRARLAAALLSSIVLTLANVLCLACCAQALGVNLPFAAALIVFSFGIGASTAIPTPGGLGGFEAGLTAGIAAYHVAGPTALAIALLYRLVSYWLPLVPGGAALIICQRRRLL